jgi:hypothetical protein
VACEWTQVVGLVFAFAWYDPAEPPSRRRRGSPGVRGAEREDARRGVSDKFLGRGLQRGIVPRRLNVNLSLGVIPIASRIALKPSGPSSSKPTISAAQRSPTRLSATRLGQLGE